MREMKDSGIEWIGEIPQNWSISPLFCYFTEGRNPNVGLKNDNLLSLSYGNIIRKDINTKDGLLPANFESYNIVRKHHIIVRTLDLQNDKKSLRTGLVKEESGIITSAYLNLVPKQYIYSPYYYYLLHVYDLIKVFYNMGNGVRQSLNFKEFSKLPLISPTDYEQKKIADYLDSKCSQIDLIIEKQKQIIEKLKEYKTSLITEVVTKGLDPNVEMKDSGVEWIGKIPKHWCYLAFRNVLFERTEKNDPICTNERLSLSIDKGVTLYAEKTTNLDRFKDDVSQYKLAYEGDLVLNSMNMIVGAVGVSNYFGCVSPAYYTYYDNKADHITSRYCDYLFRCKTMRKVLFSLGKGIMSIDRGDDRINTCRLKVSRTDLRALKIPVPPEAEQRKIVNFLNQKEITINKTISDRQIAIEKLQEYKKSLIYEVVTGKREV